MDLRDQILLDLYFPQFSSPPSSRFESLFLYLNKINSTTKKKFVVSYTILPDQVMQGEDKRTSLIIKNIPKNVKKKRNKKYDRKIWQYKFFSCFER